MTPPFPDDDLAFCPFHREFNHGTNEFHEKESDAPSPVLADTLSPSDGERDGGEGLQYTRTKTAACSASLTISSNFGVAVCEDFGSLSLAETSGTDSRKLSRKLLFTA